MKICNGTIARLHFIGLKQIKLQQEHKGSVKEGTSSILLQSRLDEQWWAESMELYCYLRNIHDVLSSEKIYTNGVLKDDFSGPIIPFRAKVEYHPIPTKEQARLHQFGKKVLSVIFLGYASMLQNLPRILDPLAFSKRVGEQNVVLSFALSFWTFFAKCHASLRAHRSCCEVS